MIKLENVTKIYKTKKKKTVALENVNLEIAGNGLVFILGKSGSGKSTLINLIAGLEKITSGKIFVDGNEITAMKNGELDVYRNSVISAVFQEYNLLNDFTVYDNLCFAAGFNHDNQEDIKSLIDSALEKVNMTEYASVKPNELSGGQRQRVAIARALVKQTPIIVLDEPTGALDGENAHNVMDILKELAKEKQILVVSHDRELSLEYADRIIELENGKIITDSNGALESEAVKINRKKPKLSFRFATRFACKSLKVKPYKLVATLIISVIAFTCFGVADTMASYNYAETLKNTIINRANDIDVVSLKGLEHFGEFKDNKSAVFYLTDEDKQKVENKLGVNVDAVLDKSIDIYRNYTTAPNQAHDEYYGRISPRAINMNNQRIEELFKGDYVGGLPQNDYEIMITKYIYEHFVKFGYQNFGENELKFAPGQVPKENEFLAFDPTLRVGDKDYKIVGIIDTKLNKDGRYKHLKNAVVLHGDEISQLQEELENSYHNLVFFRENVATPYKKFGKEILNRKINIKTNKAGYRTSIDYVTNEKDASTNGIYTYRFDGKKGLEKGEILLDVSALDRMPYKMNLSAEPPIKTTKLYFQDIVTKEGSLLDYAIENMSSYLRTAKDRVLVDYVLNNLPTTDEFVKFITDYAHSERLYKGDLDTEQQRYAFYHYIDKGGTKYLKEDVNAKWQNALYEDIIKYKVLDDFETLVIDTSFASDSMYWEKNYRQYKIVGYYVPSYYMNTSTYDVVMLSNEDYNSIAGIEGTYTNFLVPKKMVDMNKVANMSVTIENDLSYTYDGSIMPTLTAMDGTIRYAVPYLRWVSIGLMIFSLLLLTNYLLVAMIDQNKDIGILKSYGASNWNIFIIYFIKSVLIATMILLFSVILTAIIDVTINVFAFSNISALLFGGRQFGMLFAVTFGATLIANILPIIINLKKSPNELIRDK